MGLTYIMQLMQIGVCAVRPDAELHRHGAPGFSSARSQRQSHRERRSFSHFTHHVDGAAVGDNNGLADGEPEPAPALRAPARFVHAGEAVEDLRQSFGGDTRAVVRDGKNGLT